MWSLSTIAFCSAAVAPSPAGEGATAAEQNAAPEVHPESRSSSSEMVLIIIWNERSSSSEMAAHHHLE
jgi:hypothetical protein